jgi:hypothetical protein
MELIGVVKVPDAKGKIRYLVTPMLGRITMSIEGAILKVDPGLREIALRPGESVQIPVKVLRSAKLPVPVKLELKLPEELAGALKAEAVTVPPGQTSVNMRITCTKEVNSNELPAIIIRGTALQDGRYAVVSEGNINFECLKKK